MILSREHPFINGINSQDVLPFNYTLPFSSSNAVIANVFIQTFAKPPVLPDIRERVETTKRISLVNLWNIHD